MSGLVQDALFFDSLDDNFVQCLACNKKCFIANNQLGSCKARKNIDGKLISIVYGQSSSQDIFNIEHIPIKHFKQGSYCFAISTFGCNFSCKFCNNYAQSQSNPEFFEQSFSSPKEIVEKALQANCDGFAFSLTEPTIFCEYAFDIARLGKKEGLFSVWQSNGFMSKQMIDYYAKHKLVDAINISLKGDSRFYQAFVKGVCFDELLNSIKMNFDKQIHLELEYLLVPGMNDNFRQLKELVDFVKTMSCDLPLHFHAFEPSYKMTDIVLQASSNVVNQAVKFAKDSGLKNVYSAMAKNSKIVKSIIK